MPRNVAQAATLAAVAVGLSLAGGVSRTLAEETPLPVFAAEARSIPISLDRTFVGTIGARSTVDMAFEVPGRLLNVYGAVGEVLAEGSPIAELDPALTRWRWTGNGCKRRSRPPPCNALRS